MPTAESLFSRLREYGLIVCKGCKYAVWPTAVDTHLAGPHHRIEKKERQRIQQDIQSWEHLATSMEEVDLPDQIEEAIPELGLRDGLRCRVDPDACQDIFCDEMTMKLHWRQRHNWTVTGTSKGGRLTKREQQEAQRRFDEAHEKVLCQRFFASHYGSHYIRVVGRQSDNEPGSLWQRIEERGYKGLEELERRARERIEEGEKDDVSPWLLRTKWNIYLNKYSPDELRASVAPPSSDPDKPEPFEEVIWTAMTDVARISQTTVSKAGIFVRMEAIRTEKHQTRYTPLETYWDPDAIERRVQPWRQVLMFFVRTQKANGLRGPAYKFTKRQFDAMHRLIEEANRVINEGEANSISDGMSDGISDGISNGMSNGMSAIQEACLEFCIQLLSEKIAFNEYTSALVCALAVLGVGETGWRGPDSYPPILSAMIKCARFMVVQKAAQLAGPPEEDEFFSGESIDWHDSAYESNSSSPCPTRPSSTESPNRFQWSSPIRQARSSQTRPRRVTEKSCLEWVSTMMDAFMVRGTRGPMQWMLDLRTYGLKIHYNTTSQGHVEWCNGDQLLYKKAQFNMAQFRGMVHGLVAETRQILTEELLFCGPKGGRLEDEVPEIPWHTMRDDPTNTTPGWSFLDDERTRLPVNGRRWLVERVHQQARARRRFERPGSETGLDGIEVEKYMASVARFREKLLAVAHMVSQPGRGTEVLSIRHSNTWKGGHRNVFIEDGLVVFMTKYHKGYALSADVKIIHRYLPREVGELVVWYLWLVRPFERWLQTAAGGRYREVLDEDQNAWSKAVRLFCRDGDGREWTSNRIRQVLERETSKWLGHALNILAYRDVAIGISRKYMRGTAFGSASGDDQDDEEEDDIADLQAGHGSHVAEMVYARGMFEMDGALASRRRRFRESSTDWHRFLGFESAAITGTKRKRDVWEEEADAAQHERWLRLRRMNARERFARMMKLGREQVESEGGGFRGVQESALEAIQARVSPVVAVMPTGTGKSVLFMLPAWAEPGGTTLVVVPLIALRQDMQRRCDVLGISCAVWDDSRSPLDPASIVLITPEAVLSEPGSTFINILKRTRRLDRVVIDECHVALSMDRKFRPALQRLGELARAETQMVLLTATLPPSSEALLWERMSWRREEVTMFRMETARKNIRYSVSRLEHVTTMADHNALIGAMVDRMTGKGVVYCKAKDRVKKMVDAGLFACEAFHGDCNARQRARVLEAFRTGETRVVVATNALGMGVDIPDIRWIIHADEPRNMLDYAQESGRAGRDGKASQAILVTGYDEEINPMVVAYINSDCRRKIPGCFLDGQERGPCRDDEEACDVCRPSTAEAGGEQVIEDGGEHVVEDGSYPFVEQQRQMEAVRIRRMRETQDEAKMVEAVERRLLAWKGRCVVCAGLELDDRHVITNCQQAAGREAAEEVTARRVRIQFDRNSTCWKCGVPQSMCRRWEEDGSGGYRIQQGAMCQFYGIATSMVFAIGWGYREVWERWVTRLREKGVDVDRPSAVEAYLGQRKVRAGVEGCNLIWEFGWITEQIRA